MHPGTCTPVMPGPRAATGKACSSASAEGLPLTHSKRIALAFVSLAPLWIGNCTNQDDLTVALCDNLTNCTQYWKTGDENNDAAADAARDECYGEVEDALRDNRITPSGLTKCARCIKDNAQQ